MVEWQRRLFDCCGPVPHGTLGFPAAAVMEENYRRLGDGDLVRLAGRYGASFGVLYLTSQTALPVQYENRQFKVVRLSRPPSPPGTLGTEREREAEQLQRRFTAS